MGRSLLDAKGSGAIPMTPFTEDDRIDIPVLEKEIEFLVDCKVGSICTPLMVSEFMNLSQEERRLMMRVPIEVNNGDRIVLCNVAAVDLHTALSYAEYAESLGADGIIAMPPYAGFNINDTKSILHYYGEIANAVSIPVMIQNHDMAKLGTDQLVELCEKYDNISWVKQEVNPGPVSIADLAEKRSPAVEGIMSGYGARYSIIDFALGATASIHACQIADLVQKVWDLMFEGKMDEAYALQNRIMPVLTLEGLFGMSLCKEWMVRRGIFKNHIMRNAADNLKPWAMREIDRVYADLEPLFIWNK